MSENTIQPIPEAGLERQCGRSAALAVIDGIMGDADNLMTFKERIQDAFDIDTPKFFKDFVMPLIPRNVSLADAGKGVQVNIVMVDAEKKPKTVDSTEVEIIG